MNQGSERHTPTTRRDAGHSLTHPFGFDANRNHEHCRRDPYRDDQDDADATRAIGRDACDAADG